MQGLGCVGRADDASPEPGVSANELDDEVGQWRAAAVPWQWIRYPLQLVIDVAPTNPQGETFELKALDLGVAAIVLRAKC
eukprot:SAG31_NODE_3820_length_3852_cov_4.934985_5_plen_80_part_00